MYSKALVITSLLALVIAKPVGKRTVPQIRADLATVQSNTIDLDNAILAFSNTDGTLFQALIIKNDATTLDNTVNKTTTDIKSTGPVSGADGSTILNDVTTIKPIVIKTLQDAIAKRPGADRLGVTSLVRSGLQTLQRDSQALGSALVSNVPSSLLPQATPITSSINAAFATAVAAFS